MKSLLLIICVITSPMITFSQISEAKKVEPQKVIGTIKSVGMTQHELSYRINEGDTLYTLMYRNADYKYITEFEFVNFSGEDNTLDKLYDILKSVFSEENKKNKEYQVKFKLGEKDVIVSNFRTMGVTSVMFFTHDGHCFWTEKQIDKLFGKD